MHLNNLIKSSDEYNQTYLVVGKCYRHFILKKFYFPASGHSEIGEFEALTSLLCCNPKKLLHGIDNDNGQSGLIFDL